MVTAAMDGVTNDPLLSHLGLPPGPRFGWLQMLRYLRDPYRYYRWLIRRYGDPALMPTVNGPLVITSHPEGVRAILSLTDEEAGPWLPEILAPVVGQHSLLTIEGEPHKRDRKLQSPPFHGARMRTYGRLMLDIAAAETERWRLAEPFDLRRSTQAISLHIILRAVFGVVDSERAKVFEEATIRYIALGNRPTLFFPFLQHNFGGIGPWAAFLRVRQHFLGLIEEQIREARTRKLAGDDIMSLLISARYEDGSGMDDARVCDSLVTLLLAGHETTAQSLSWAMYHLHRNPDKLSRLSAELLALGKDPDPETIAAVPYLDAVCSETLRCYPIVGEILRTVHRPLQFFGYTLPAESAVGASAILLHHRQDLYPDAEVFRPERFLNRKFSPFEYIPFGGGPRRCLGAAFAMYEMKLVLYAFVTRCRMRLASAKPILPMVHGITMGPRGGMPMVLEKRI